MAMMGLQRKLTNCKQIKRDKPAPTQPMPNKPTPWHLLTDLLCEKTGRMTTWPLPDITSVPLDVPFQQRCPQTQPILQTAQNAGRSHSGGKQESPFSQNQEVDNQKAGPNQRLPSHCQAMSFEPSRREKKLDCIVRQPQPRFSVLTAGYTNCGFL